MLEIWRALEDCGYFSGAQDHRQSVLVPRVGNEFDHPVPMQDVVVEKPQRAYSLIELRPRELFTLDQAQLILADVFGSELIGRGVKMLGKVGHTTDVCTLGVG